MRRIYLLLLFLALLAIAATACGGGGDAVPTAAPTVPAESLGEEGEASPRVDASTSIPPTWTPQAPAAQATPAPAPVDDDDPVSGGEGDVYVVQAGDTLAEIAARFGVDLNVLADANDIENVDHIEVGQELLIPQQ
ncbi:MAG: LysM peptidoglycan-binding domain-containing protein [Candidatus Promineifilaceae bacterium]|nr:LysM peptidoglycan-binding domain-containing protein [Candidatus Promineifilaceae bacterium]